MSTRRARRLLPLLAVAGPALALAVSAAFPALASGPEAGGGRTTSRAACGPAAAPYVRCFATYRTAAATPRRPGGPPAGWGPADLQSAYRLPAATAGAGQTIAIVDAFDNPNAEADLAVYRRTFGLPPCSTANGCFRKLNQRGQARPLPAADPGWGVEISLDLDMVSAACPRCSITLLEGDEPTIAALGQAVDTAVRLGAAAVSNSYGTAEFNGLGLFAHYYRHPGTTILAASGDFGFGPATFPAVLPSVIAVGGTTLRRDASTARGWTEAAWAFAGSGCSAYVAKPAWQHDAHCPGRTVADVSAVADRLAVYDTFELPGWVTVGGTSASTPLIAGVYGLAGNGKSVSPAYPYRHRGGLFDVVGGSNGFCGHDYLCTGRPGYDAPTGLGTPRGAGAF